NIPVRPHNSPGSGRCRNNSEPDHFHSSPGRIHRTVPVPGHSHSSVPGRHSHNNSDGSPVPCVFRSFSLPSFLIRVFVYKSLKNSEYQYFYVKTHGPVFYII